MKQITFLIALLFFTTSLFANNDFLKSLQNKNPKLTETILIFHKPDCPYCEQMGKLIESDVYLQQKTKEKFNVTIVDISTEEGKKIAKLYDVRAVPTIIKYSSELQSFSTLKGFGSNVRFSNFLGLELENNSVSDINRGIPPLCGNGIVESGEQCDDGNLNNGDGCSSTCLIESAVCGDGNIQPGEQCDDANTTNGDGCNAICNVEFGYTCTGSPSVCSPAICGDGVVASGEQCDDGNTTNGDGCNAVCSVEFGFTCSGSPSVCSPGVCGNGVITSGEQCDDGNLINGDGCSATCLFEGAVCGDGNVAPTEQCDDANTTNGDGCNSICVVESGFNCVGSPSVCSVLGLEATNTQFAFLKTYPNPFSNVINTTVYLKDASEVEISLIDNRGKLIKTIKKSNLTFGENEISIPIDDALQDGLYFMKIQVTNSNGVFYETQKLIKK